MILYNVTVIVDEPIHEEWLHWMKQVHVPEVLATGAFTDNKICRILGYEEGGISYSVQYLCSDLDTYNKYQEEFAPALQQKHTERYQGKFAAFRTVLEVLHHQTKELNGTT